MPRLLAALPLLVFLVPFISAGAREYVQIPKTCMPWNNALDRVGGCGFDVGVPCNISALALACDALPSCNAFNSNGFLKNCPLGRCDCDSGSSSCLRGLDIFSTDPAVSYGCDHTDLFVLAGQPPPADLAAGVAEGLTLWGSPEAAPCYMPEVANGYFGASIGWGAAFVSGLFNGACGSVRKARLPSPLAVSLVLDDATAPPVTLLGGALDTVGGVYRRRYRAASAVAGAPVDFEMRYYAHRVRRNVAVVELEALARPPDASDYANVSLLSLWSPWGGGGGSVGDGCAGSFTIDLDFFNVSSMLLFNNGSTAAVRGDARTTVADDRGGYVNVTMIAQAGGNGSFFVAGGPEAPPPPLRLIAVVATSLDLPSGAGPPAAVGALAEAVFASALAAGEGLPLEHAAAWAALSSASGIDVEPPEGADADTRARCLDIQTHISSSLYFLRSSLREDWSAGGVSPGGISSGSYNGAVFMDMDVWMAPALYLLNPPLAASTLAYRAVSVTSGTDEALAALFKYEGSMLAWTAAFEGRPFGCCGGSGGYEDCLEQHVTGDAAWSAWQFYSATGNASWLAAFGWPILAGAADFHLSRVSFNAATGNYSMRGVLPVDEWCVGSGCGCETPGVDDDAQMNAVVRLSLLNAAAAARALGMPPSNRTAAWESVGARVNALMNASGGHHNQFDSPSCPGGWGGSHYDAAHAVCPEDVMLLTYPWGDALGTTLEVTAADAALFMPLTCRENAGMTTPIHSIVFSQLGDATGAIAELNRSMHAAAYGPFNVRNEVDKHPDIVGAHYDNAHFITGDGGFLQAILNGYGGLRIVDRGLKILQPSLPAAAVGTLTLRGLSWRGFTLNATTTVTALTLDVVNAAVATSTRTLALYDNKGACQDVSMGATTSLQIATFAWPALLVNDTAC